MDTSNPLSAVESHIFLSQSEVGPVEEGQSSFSGRLVEIPSDNKSGLLSEEINTGQALLPSRHGVFLEKREINSIYNEGEFMRFFAHLERQYFKCNAVAISSDVGSGSSFNQYDKAIVGLKDYTDKARVTNKDHELLLMKNAVMGKPILTAYGFCVVFYKDGTSRVVRRSDLNLTEPLGASLGGEWAGDQSLGYFDIVNGVADQSYTADFSNAHESGEAFETGVDDLVKAFDEANVDRSETSSKHGFKVCSGVWRIMNHDYKRGYVKRFVQHKSHFELAVLQHMKRGFYDSYISCKEIDSIGIFSTKSPCSVCSLCILPAIKEELKNRCSSSRLEFNFVQDGAARVLPSNDYHSRLINIPMGGLNGREFLWFDQLCSPAVFRNNYWRRVDLMRCGYLKYFNDSLDKDDEGRYIEVREKKIGDSVKVTFHKEVFGENNVVCDVKLKAPQCKTGFFQSLSTSSEVSNHDKEMLALNDRVLESWRNDIPYDTEELRADFMRAQENKFVSEYLMRSFSKLFYKYRMWPEAIQASKLIVKISKNDKLVSFTHSELAKVFYKKAGECGGDVRMKLTVRSAHEWRLSAEFDNDESSKKNKYLNSASNYKKAYIYLDKKQQKSDEELQRIANLRIEYAAAMYESIKFTRSDSERQFLPRNALQVLQQALNGVREEASYDRHLISNMVSEMSDCVYTQRYKLVSWDIGKAIGVLKNLSGLDFGHYCNENVMRIYNLLVAHRKGQAGRPRFAKGGGAYARRRRRPKPY